MDTLFAAPCSTSKLMVVAAFAVVANVGNWLIEGINWCVPILLNVCYD